MKTMAMIGISTAADPSGIAVPVAAPSALSFWIMICRKRRADRRDRRPRHLLYEAACHAIRRLSSHGLMKQAYECD